MALLLVKRFIGSIAVLISVSLLAFLLFFLAPGDPATVIIAQRIGRLPPPDMVATLSVEYGLDKPILVQYVDWVTRAVQGDFGISLRTHEPVAKEIGKRIGATVLLASTATLISILLAIPIGFLAAWKVNSFWDHAARTAAMVSVSIPNFWLAYLLILLFSITLSWLPTHGNSTPLHIILPVICLAAGDTARLSRLTRSGFLEVSHEKYLIAARAKGLLRRNAWIRHALPNIAGPLVTLIATQFGYIIAGSVIVETLFAWPGIGNLFISSINFRDLAVTQALILLFGAVFASMNLIADLICMAIDPRISRE